MPALEQMKQMLLPLRLEAAQQRLDQLMEAAFIQTAPADRLAVWERILGLPAQSEGPLERRAAILARLSLGPPGFTRAETESLLEQAGFPGSLQEDCAAATLRLRFGGSTISFALCAPLVHAIEQSLPAQLKIWADIPAKSWDALDAADTAFHDWDALSLRWELQEENE